MIGPEVRSALRSALKEVQRRVASDPTRFHCPDPDYKRDAIAAVAANLVADRLDVSHIPIAKLALAALQEFEQALN